MSASTPTRPSLLLALRDLRDDQAWAEFVTLYTPLIYGHCVRRGLQDADAADVAQEVLKSVAGAMGNFDYDPERGSFRGWLLTVVRSKLNRFLSRQSRLPLTPGDTQVKDLAGAPSVDEDDAAWEAECRERLFHWACARVQGEFQERTWQAFWQTAVAARSVTQVAAELGLSAGAVYIARSRVIARLRTEIAAAGGEGNWPVAEGGIP